MTPLHVAALKDAGRAAQMLLDRGAEVGARAHDGVTPLYAAALKDAGEVLTQLLTSSAAPEAADAAGQAPLHWAAVGDAAGAASVLVDQGAHVHGRAADGSTALHAAAFTNAGAVRMLLARGADVHAADDAGLMRISVKVEHAFRGCGTRTSAKWNARRSAATLRGRSLPFGSRALFVVVAAEPTPVGAKRQAALRGGVVATVRRPVDAGPGTRQPAAPPGGALPLRVRQRGCSSLFLRPRTLPPPRLVRPYARDDRPVEEGDGQPGFGEVGEGTHDSSGSQLLLPLTAQP